MEPRVLRETVKEYYGKVLKSRRDLKSSCCTAAPPPRDLAPIYALIEGEVLERFYGCGSPIPELLEGITALDLGCGTGRDCFLLSYLAGPKGRVIGVDMTKEQLEVGRRHLESITRKFGFSHPNVSFREGLIEDLASAGIEDESVDVVVSNCVINLSPDKEAVFREIFRVLKPGGELCFSDVFCDRRVPEEIRQDPLFHAECLGGAMYIEDFRRLLSGLGIPDFRVIRESPVTLAGSELEEKGGNLRFRSLTIRAFKLSSLEDRCEDYGQVAVYKGTIPGRPHRFELDDHHSFEAHRPFPVCGNTAAMLGETRFAPHFEVQGDRSRHFGLFDCSALSRREAPSRTSCC